MSCRPLRLLAVALSACAAVFALPAGAASAQSASDLRVVVTKTNDGFSGTNQVLTARLKNNGSTDWQPYPEPDAATRVLIQGNLVPRSIVQLRSNYGWTCEYSATNYDSNRRASLICELQHAITAGQYSLPLEVEVSQYDTAVNTSQVAVVGYSFTASAVVTTLDDSDEAGAPASSIHDFTWDSEGSTLQAPGVKAEASSTPASPTTQEATVGLSAQSAGPISTGVFSQRGYLWPEQYSGYAFMVYPEMVITLPSDKIELLSLKAYAPAANGLITKPPFTGGTTARSFVNRILDVANHPDERVLEAGVDYVADGPDRYVVNFAGAQRFLPGHPWRFVAKVRLKDGVDAAPFTVDAIHEPEIFSESGRAGRAGRALFTGPYSATATTTVTRAATPVPDSGGVQNQVQAPVLTGKARFRDEEISVGKRTTLRVTVANSGNAPSTAPRVCVRISSHLVVIKVPKGVTVKGSLLCAPLPTIAPGQTVTAAAGIVLRGVRTTDKAKVRDGAQEGIPVSGDDLRIVGGQIRAGGVTG